MNFKNNSKRALVVIMSAFFLASIFVTHLFYKNKNKYDDYRVLQAKELYGQYDNLAQQNKFKEILILLDSIENYYFKFPHYKDSYEMGVLNNNRAATFLTMALHFEDSSLSIDGVNILTKDTLLKLGARYVLNSINNYENWLLKFGGKSKLEISNLLNDNFFIGMDSMSKQESDKYLKHRIKDIELAQYETKRRLSVAYTNLGIVKRHQKDYEEAIKNYEKALILWDKNLTAKNNINILLGRPIEKRSVLQRFFPPDKAE